MKCLIVTAHPLQDGLCSFFSEKVAQKLQKMGHDVKIDNLYAEKFDPALSRSERISYYDEPYDISKMEDQVARLKEAEGLVLLYPTWWFGFPAVLKGWFDRVWGPGVAFDHTENFGPIKSRLDKLEKVLAITTLGAPWWVDRLIMRQPLKRVLKTAILGTCARSSKLKYMSLYKTELLSKQQISDFTSKIESTIESWFV